MNDAWMIHVRDPSAPTLLSVNRGVIYSSKPLDLVSGRVKPQNGSTPPSIPPSPASRVFTHPSTLFSLVRPQ